MLPYFILYIIPAILAISHISTQRVQTNRWSIYWIIFTVILILMIGMRHEVGGDWQNDLNGYIRYFGEDKNPNLIEAIQLGDPGYTFLIWIVIEMGQGIYLLDTLSAIPFTWGLIVFCRKQTRPWLAMVVAVPYLVTVVAMGYTRQSVAIGLCMVGFVFLSENKKLRFIILIGLAATFHKSAVILLPLAILANTRNKLLTILWVSVSTFLLFILLLQESVDKLILNYIGAKYNSEGAGIRIAMNALPAAIFLYYKKYFLMNKNDLVFWSWMSLGSLFFIVLLAISPSSTAVDRVALYWIPIQIFVFSRLPNAMAEIGGKSTIWVYLVVLYCGVIQFVWLLYADTAFAWLPYQFFPWILLWK